ncbi:microcin C transport system permease protein [Dongia mobilis]|uniref:Microcin C transport system permease protein n=1 Tax=Dongia mobilis TaxID=578943 RepID=A0A4R6WWW1_9PROT|nr:ABC transporter permease [Dongia mobilis]TDQ85496.1 microcin C transport system permease protein [Dongia mobilis]
MTIASPRPRILGLGVSPVTHRRWLGFLANRRGFWSLMLFLALFALSLPAEFIANDKPIAVAYRDEIYWPVFREYGDETFGGIPGLRADFTQPDMQQRVAESGGWMIWPPIPYAYNTVVLNLPGPAPTPPDAINWLGTDDQARDVMARVIYGFRISVLFGLALTIVSTVVGVLAGAVQGYFGGWVDLLAQRFLEIWESLPALYILIIVAAVIVPGFWTLLILLLIFSWTWPISVVRAEFLRARNLEYVRAAKALGLGDWRIMIRHMLPNAMVATLTFLPFTLSGSVTALTSLDFLGFGLPPGSPSLGELLKQGKDNLQAPWLGLTGFFVIGLMLTLLIFIGEAVRDAFDPRKGHHS